MNRLIWLFLLSSCFIAFGQESVRSSTLTLGVGGLPYSDHPYYPTLQKGGPTFTGNYEFRLSRYLAAEGGTDILLPSAKSFAQVASISAGQNLYSFNCVTNCSGTVSRQSRVTLVTYGLKGILPIAKDRLELFAGVGGAYGWNSKYKGGLNSPFAQASVGSRLTLDRAHRFWLGATLRGFSSFGPGRQAWAPLTFDFGIRFPPR